MGGEIDGGIVFDKLPNTVQGDPGGLDVLEDDGQFIRLQGGIRVGDIAVEHVVQASVFGNDDAVAVGMAFGFNEIDAIGNLLAGREVLVRAVLVGDAHNVLTREFQRIGILRGHIDLGMGEVFQSRAVVGMLVGKENLRNLLRFPCRSYLAGSHLQRTGETMAPSFLSSAKALSTSLRSAFRALVTSPADTGLPASRMAWSTCSFMIE